MSLKVLQNKLQIENSRQRLIEKGASCMESSFRSFMRRFGLAGGVALGDQVKSWDVLETLNFIEQYVQKEEPILDIGCYASEIIVALLKSGYTNLTGADLNSGLNQMPGQGVIHYEITDFMHTPFDDASFKVITSISVIEHGFDGQSLLKEMSRLLQKGGYFIASFDYWPEKIDTTGIKFFDMDWLIFFLCQLQCLFLLSQCFRGLFEYKLPKEQHHIQFSLHLLQFSLSQYILFR